MGGKVTSGRMTSKVPETLMGCGDVKPPYSLRQLVNQFYSRNKFGGRNEDVQTSQGIITNSDWGTLLFYLNEKDDKWYNSSLLIGGSGKCREYKARYGAEGVLNNEEVYFEAEFTCIQILKLNSSGQYVNDGKPKKEIVRQDLEPYWFVTDAKKGSGGERDFLKSRNLL